jgi:hypothetical protein
MLSWKGDEDLVIQNIEECHDDSIQRRRGPRNMNKPDDRPVIVDDPVLAVNLVHTYKQGMGAKALYECARGIWRLSLEHANEAMYVFAVFQGTIIEVYAVERWEKAGTTPYTWRVFQPEELFDRFEFVGVPAPEAIRKKYLGSQVPEPFTQNPVHYFNC